MSKEKNNAANTPRTGKPKKRRRHPVRRVIVTLLVLAVLGLVGFNVYSGLKAEYTVTYMPYTATTGSIFNALSISANVSVKDSETHTAAAAATVRSIRVAEGDYVKKDDVLLRLSTGGSVKAGIDGRVNRIYVAEGDEVAAGAELCQIADFDHMEVSMRVDEYDIGSVQVGQECTITTTATEQTFTSKIKNIDYISTSTGTVAYYTALCDLEVKPEDSVYPGMQVTVSIPQESAENVVVLREDALSFDETNSAFVYLKGEGDEMTPQKVTVGVSNGNYVEIKDGIASGDTVYVVAKKTETNPWTMMMQSGFGSNRVMPGSGRQWNQNGQNGQGNRNNNGGNGNNGGGR